MKIFYEDYVIDQRVDIEVRYRVSREEIIEMGKRWDPQPFHIDEQAAKNSIFGGLVASSAHIFPIFVWLGQQSDRDVAALSALGFDKLRLYAPIRPGDELSYYYYCAEKRLSNSKPHCGIIRCVSEMHNQRGELVFSGEVASLIATRDHPQFK
jgi:acyl dehydratase